MKKFLYAMGLIAATLPAKAQAPVKPFQSNDRVVFVGNSITEAGAYVSYIYLYYMTHFPGRPLVIMNAGVGGDRAGDIYRRLEYDVLAKHPNVIVLTFGMNDTGYFEFNGDNAAEKTKERIALSHTEFNKIEARLLQLPSVTKILMASSPYDETSKFNNNVFKGKQKAMLEIANFQEAAAQEHHWGFVDLLRPLTTINEKLQEKDPNFTLIGPDRIHPGNAGHLVMAAQFLKDQGLAGKPVANVQIDAAAAKVKQAENCQVSKLAVTSGNLHFTYLAQSLPFPLDTVSRIFGNSQKQVDALQWIPFTEEFNQEILQVQGLADGDYTLKMDGHVIGHWPAAAFSQGINLALQPETPEYKQAQSIMTLNMRRAEIEARFRSYAWIQGNYLDKRGMRMQDDAAALDTIRLYAKTDGFLRFHSGNYETAQYKELRDVWQQEIDTIIKLVYKLDKPVPHQVEIVKN
ncbi:Lysophospholipase L1 [Chitinophaga costaii]|uniref:Lysophospholipase L1 n=1 Tax=Chitinophaga costaii TaxID=1335309 RepID=A0A1C4AVJ4_9BACT|nr:SGNH/GDSL hydrolase family protein [Chitinophaga costaii]PUZ26763.1 GDSL family lipase [Chitinophaga costaii]SCB98645.1 Lysophospholipase L1 [Chitinophaga costaii]